MPPMELSRTALPRKRAAIPAAIRMATTSVFRPRLLRLRKAMRSRSMVLRRIPIQLVRCKKEKSQALAAEHRHDRLEKDRDVQQDGHVLHVVQVVLQLLVRVLYRGGMVLARHLVPPGDTWLDEQALAIIGNRLFQPGGQPGTLGTRPDEAHLTDENVDCLRDLVQAQLP